MNKMLGRSAALATLKSDNRLITTRLANEENFMAAYLIGVVACRERGPLDASSPLAEFRRAHRHDRQRRFVFQKHRGPDETAAAGRGFPVVAGRSRFAF